VARAAGVSIATVSRVFNDNSLVSEDTTRRVLEVAASVDYWPNGAAQSLTTNRSNTFGVLLPDLFGEFYSEVIRGIDHVARRSRYQILLASSHASGEDIQAATRAMLGRVDGMLMMAPDPTSIETVQKLRKRVPVVLLNPSFEVEGCCSVAVDNYAGAHAVVNHLLRLGHREIAMVAGPAGNVDAEERLRGFREALAVGGLDPERARIIPGDFHETSGYAAGCEIMARRPRPTAIFAANDNMAIGLLSALRTMSVRVPEDIAVVGFDDVTTARYLNPPLTTVNVDAFGLGQQAVGMMLGALDSDEERPCPRQTLPAVLTVRESCGAQLQRNVVSACESTEPAEPVPDTENGNAGPKRTESRSS
jgi:LacI family transcriptional regulator